MIIELKIIDINDYDKKQLELGTWRIILAKIIDNKDWQLHRQ